MPREAWERCLCHPNVRISIDALDAGHLPDNIRANFEQCLSGDGNADLNIFKQDVAKIKADLEGCLKNKIAINQNVLDVVARIAEQAASRAPKAEEICYWNKCVYGEHVKCAEICPDGKNPATWSLDTDGDGYGDPNKPVVACAPPPGYVSNGSDCNDSARLVNPGSVEVCNDLDDNCNGSTDEGVTRTFYRDADGDKYGDPSQPAHACSTPSGHVDNPGDCYDKNANASPKQTDYFEQHRGDGSFDFDCDGKERQKSTSVERGCFRHGNLPTGECTANKGWVGTVPRCGDQGQWLDDCDTESNFPRIAECRRREESPERQACR